jgi:hypothetical protein
MCEPLYTANSSGSAGGWCRLWNSAAESTSAQEAHHGCKCVLVTDVVCAALHSSGQQPAAAAALNGVNGVVSRIRSRSQGLGLGSWVLGPPTQHSTASSDKMRATHKTIITAQHSTITHTTLHFTTTQHSQVYVMSRSFLPS